MLITFYVSRPPSIFMFFFFNDTATTEIYTLSLHDALPIFPVVHRGTGLGPAAEEQANTVLKGREFTLVVDLGIGHAEATVWTTDLSPEYVKINASYRS